MLDYIKAKMLARKARRGQTLVEYGLILALIAIVVIAALSLLGPTISNVFTNINESIEGAMNQ